MSHDYKHMHTHGGTLNFGKTGSSITSVGSDGTRVTTGTHGTTITTPISSGGSIITHTDKTGTHTRSHLGRKH